MSPFSGRTVLVTGGTGSFGQQFVRTLLDGEDPRSVRVYSRDELKQYEMRSRLQDDTRLRFLIGDVRDRDRTRRAAEGAEVVVHAAALKQVTACEDNPFEAVKTNVLGTQNVIDACIDAGVERAMFVSTDKAVNPANLYGATKTCAEKLFVQANVYVGARPTILSCVRYGNVAGSRGSVVPLFLRQAAVEGVLTITDREMTRFWLTLEEAVAFVINCLGRMRGGEVFVPKIPSVRVVDIAEAIAPEASIRVTGIRPGEKLHEALLGDEEARHTIDGGDCYVVEPEHPFKGDRLAHEGVPVAADFVYTSGVNSTWLGVERLREVIRTLNPERRLPSATSG